MDKSKKDREWHVKAVKGDKHTLMLTELKTSTLYYFKIQARNERGYGPFSPIASATTGQSKNRSNNLLSFFIVFYFRQILLLFLLKLEPKKVVFFLFHFLFPFYFYLETIEDSVVIDCFL